MAQAFFQGGIIVVCKWWWLRWDFFSVWFDVFVLACTISSILPRTFVIYFGSSNYSAPPHYLVWGKKNREYYNLIFWMQQAVSLSLYFYFFSQIGENRKHKFHRNFILSFFMLWGNPDRKRNVFFIFLFLLFLSYSLVLSIL